LIGPFFFAYTWMGIVAKDEVYVRVHRMY